MKCSVIQQHTHTHTPVNNILVSSPSKCKQLWKPARPDWHNGLPPSVLSLTLWGVTPHGGRWRDPPRLNEMTPSHRHTLTHTQLYAVRPLIGPPGSV